MSPRPNPFRLDPYRPEAERAPRRKRRSRPVSISEVLKPWLDSGLKEGSPTRLVFRTWEKVVGEALAKKARPTKFQKGELMIEVSSMVHLHELKNFTGETYRFALNQQLGGSRVERLTFKLSH